MRALFLLLALSFSISAQAIEGVNHVSCMYLKTTGEWSSWNYSFMENLSMQPGENRLVNSYWSGLGSQAVNRAFCSAILATQENDAIEIDLIAYKGSDFEGFDYDGTCIPLGKQLQLESKKTYRVERGQYAELKLKWVPAEKGLLILREYFPRKEELADLRNTSDQICQRIMPDEMKRDLNN